MSSFELFILLIQNGCTGGRRNPYETLVEKGLLNRRTHTVTRKGKEFLKSLREFINDRKTTPDVISRDDTSYRDYGQGR